MSKMEKIQTANELLRKAGFTYAGRPKGEVNCEQSRFEKRLIVVPMGIRK